MNYAARDNNICVCCGTEFGYDDHNLSFSDLRLEWIENGAGWWDDSLENRPPNWRASTQVINTFGQAAWDSADDRFQLKRLRQRFGDGNAAPFSMLSHLAGINQINLGNL